MDPLDATKDAGETCPPCEPARPAYRRPRRLCECGLEVSKGAPRHAKSRLHLDRMALLEQGATVEQLPRPTIHPPNTWATPSKWPQECPLCKIVVGSASHYKSRRHALAVVKASLSSAPEAPSEVLN